MLTADMFVHAFGCAWRQRIAEDQEADRIARCFEDNKAWTEYMLSLAPRDEPGGSRAGLLADVADRLVPNIADLVYHGREIYTLDAVFAGRETGADLCNRLEGGYPSRLYALIEHENGEPLEEEMWKLLWWRAPLKVIIGYDYWQSERDSNPRKQTWLGTKLALLADMWQRVDAFFPENPASEYLVLIGAPRDLSADSRERELPAWRYAVLPETRMNVLP